MRKNYPITQEQYNVPEGVYLISKTNTLGKIHYINPIFEEVSGFARDELIGADHNIVRHPDMPPAVFKDMWETLQSMQAWEGVVKNRRKDGGYYWVYARAVPIIEEGKHTGYASIRVRATPEQVQQSSRHYEALMRDPHRKVGQKSIAQLVARAARLCFGSSFKSRFLRLSVSSTATVAFALYGALAHSTFSKTESLVVPLLVLGSLGVTLIGGARVIRRMLFALRASTRIAQQVAIGNLRVQIKEDERAPQEIRQLAFYLDFMRRNLAGIANDAKNGVYASLEASNQLHSNSRDLSNRSQEQLESLTLTTERVMQLASAVNQSSDKATQANQLAQSSRSAAQRGGGDVQAVVALMQDIHTHSRQISEITNLIESIAFQTNILALNAAVEAARAGEQGRGFAVVAAEVRNLALRSSSAAQDIKDLTQTSVDRINAGLRQAEQAGSTMEGIVHEVEKVADMIAAITASTQEQNEGLAKTNDAIHLLSQLSHENEKSVSAVNDTAQAINVEAERLEHSLAILSTKNREEGLHKN